MSSASSAAPKSREPKPARTQQKTERRRAYANELNSLVEAARSLASRRVGIMVEVTVNLGGVIFAISEGCPLQPDVELMDRPSAIGYAIKSAVTEVADVQNRDAIRKSQMRKQRRAPNGDLFGVKGDDLIEVAEFILMDKPLAPKGDRDFYESEAKTHQPIDLGLWRGILPPSHPAALGRELVSKPKPRPPSPSAIDAPDVVAREPAVGTKRPASSSPGQAAAHREFFVGSFTVGPSPKRRRVPDTMRRIIVSKNNAATASETQIDAATRTAAPCAIEPTLAPMDLLTERLRAPVREPPSSLAAFTHHINHRFIYALAADERAAPVACAPVLPPPTQLMRSVEEDVAALLSCDYLPPIPEALRFDFDYSSLMAE